MTLETIPDYYQIENYSFRRLKMYEGILEYHIKWSYRQTPYRESYRFAATEDSRMLQDQVMYWLKSQIEFYKIPRKYFKQYYEQVRMDVRSEQNPGTISNITFYKLL